MSNPNNPNNCNTCKHKKTPQGGWCYMFRDEPTGRCAQYKGPLLIVGHHRNTALIAAILEINKRNGYE